MAKALVLLSALVLVSACERAPAPAPEPAPNKTIGAATQPVVRPELASCRKLEPLEWDERIRTEPITFPKGLAGIVASDADRIAVATLSGKTFCVDARWIEEIAKPTLTPDGRFLTFDWVGNEAFGHVIVDRSGAGQEIDTGVTPLISPSGRRIAALDYSESSYGALNAFAVWDVEPARLTEVVKIEELPQGHDWRLDRWVGEDCLELSMITWDDLSASQDDPAEAPRQRFAVRPAGGKWAVAEGGCRRP